MLLNISILMEFAICSFLFLILFVGILFNLKITNNKRVKEIKENWKIIMIGINKFKISKNDF